MGRGYGTFDSSVASDTRKPGFECTNWQIYSTIIYCQLFVEKAEIKKNRPRIAHLKNCLNIKW